MCSGKCSECEKECNRIVITERGETGPQGPPGIQGEKGETGASGSNGLNGADGENGTTLLYSDLKIMGNDDPIGESLLYTFPLPSDTLLDDEEMEIYMYIQYTNNDQVDLKFKFSALQFITIPIIDTNDDQRVIRIKVSRINQNSQLWTIEMLTKDSLGAAVVTDISFQNTAFDLATASNFEVIADNLALGANQVLSRKIAVYKYNY